MFFRKWAGLAVNHCCVVASPRSMTSFSRESRKDSDILRKHSVEQHVIDASVESTSGVHNSKASLRADGARILNTRCDVVN